MELYRQIVVIPIDTKRATLEICFCFVMKSLSDNYIGSIEAFVSNSILDDLLNIDIDNPYPEQIVGQTYPK